MLTLLFYKYLRLCANIETILGQCYSFNGIFITDRKFVEISHVYMCIKHVIFIFARTNNLTSTENGKGIKDEYIPLPPLVPSSQNHPPPALLRPPVHQISYPKWPLFRITSFSILVLINTNSCSLLMATRWDPLRLHERCADLQLLS